MNNIKHDLQQKLPSNLPPIYQEYLDLLDEWKTKVHEESLILGYCVAETIEEQKTILNSLDAEVKKIEENEEGLKLKITDWYEKHRELENQSYLEISRLRLEIKRKEDAIKILESELATKDKAFQKIIKEKVEENKLSNLLGLSLTNTVNLLTDENEVLKEENNELTAENSKLKTETDRLKDQKKEIEIINASLSEKLTSAPASSSVLDIRTKNNQLEKENEKLKTEKNKWNEHIAKLSKDYEDELNKINKEYSEKLTTQEEELKKQQDANEELRYKNKQLSAIRPPLIRTNSGSSRLPLSISRTNSEISLNSYFDGESVESPTEDKFDWDNEEEVAGELSGYFNNADGTSKERRRSSVRTHSRSSTLSHRSSFYSDESQITFKLLHPHLTDELGDAFQDRGFRLGSLDQWIEFFTGRGLNFNPHSHLNFLNWLQENHPELAKNLNDWLAKKKISASEIETEPTAEVKNFWEENGENIVKYFQQWETEHPEMAKSNPSILQEILLEDLEGQLVLGGMLNQQVKELELQKKLAEVSSSTEENPPVSSNPELKTLLTGSLEGVKTILEMMKTNWETTRENLPSYPECYLPASWEEALITFLTPSEEKGEESDDEEEEERLNREWAERTGFDLASMAEVLVKKVEEIEIKEVRFDESSIQTIEKDFKEGFANAEKLTEDVSSELAAYQAESEENSEETAADPEEEPANTEKKAGKVKNCLTNQEAYLSEQINRLNETIDAEKKLQAKLAKQIAENEKRIAEQKTKVEDFERMEKMVSNSNQSAEEEQKSFCRENKNKSQKEIERCEKDLKEKRHRRKKSINETVAYEEEAEWVVVQLGEIESVQENWKEITTELLTVKAELKTISSTDEIGSEIGSEISELRRQGEEIKRFKKETLSSIKEWSENINETVPVEASELAEWKRKVEELMEKLNRYEEARENFEALYNRLQELLIKKNNQVRLLNQKLQELRNKYNKNLQKEKVLLDANFKKQQQQINSLMEELKEVQAKEKGNQNFIEEAKREYKKKESELTKLKKEFEEYKTNIRGTISKNNELWIELKEAKKEIKDLKNEIKGQEKEVEIAQGMVKSVTETSRTGKGELMIEVVEQEETIIRQEARIKELEADLESGGAAVETLTKAFGEEKSKLETKLAEINSEKEGLTAQITKLNIQIKELTDNYEGAVKRRDKDRGKLETAETENKELQAKLNAAETEKTELVAQLTASKEAEKNATANIAALTAEKKLREAQVTDLKGKEAELKKVNNEVKSWEMINAELADEFNELKNVIATKDSELVAREAKIKKDAELLESSAAAIEKSEKDWESLNTDYEGLEKEKEAIEEKLIKTENKIENITEEKKIMERNLTSLQSENSHLQEENNSLSSKLYSNESELFWSNKKIRQIERETANLNQQISDLRGEITSKEAEITRLTDELAEMTTDRDKALTELPEMVDMGARKTKDRIQDLTGIPCSAELNLGEIEAKLAGAKLSDLPGTLAQYIKDKKALEKQLKELNKKIDLLNQNCRQEKASHKETQKQKEEIEKEMLKLQSQLDNNKKEYEKSQKNWEKEKGELTIQITNLTADPTERETVKKKTLTTTEKEHVNCPTLSEIEQAQKDFDLLTNEKNNLATELTAATNDLTKETSAKQKHLKNYRIALLRLATQKRKVKKQSQQDHNNYQQLIKGYQNKYNQEKNDLQNWKDDHVCSAPSHTCRGCHEPTHTNFSIYENYLQHTLKITDLSKLPPPPTDLTTLINFYFNPPTHTCPPCPLPHLPESHVCPINQINCSHTDYEQIKKERDNLNAKLNQFQQDYQKLQNKLDQQEQEIIRLRELLNKPPTIISKNGEEWTIIKTQFLANWEKLFSSALLQTYQKKIQQTTNYQQIIQLEKQLIQAEINQREKVNYNLVKDKERLSNWNWGLIILLVVNVLITISVLRKKLRRKKK